MAIVQRVDATAGDTAMEVLESNERTSPRATHLAWHALSSATQIYLATIIAAGAGALAAFFPLAYPRPVLFVVLLVVTCVTAAWEVKLPLALKSGPTLPLSYGASLMSLLLLGPRHAVVIAVAGVWTQCRYRVKPPDALYRTLFRAAAGAIAMVASAQIYRWLGGSTGMLQTAVLPQPLAGTMAAYLIVHTGLAAGAIALSSGRSFGRVWRKDLLWSGAGFMATGSAGALAAVIVERGGPWTAMLMLAPAYLTYRTYRTYQGLAGRRDDQHQHLAEAPTLHQQVIDAVERARQAEHALAIEKDRLTVALTNMTQLEETHHQLLKWEHDARQSAERANQLKDQFLAIVSHELRTPLTAMFGWADLLRRGLVDHDRRDRALQSIFDSAKRQSQLIDDLLDLARIISGKLRLERTEFNPDEVARNAIEGVLPSADAKRIRVALEADSSIGTFYGDPARLQQILSNLLSNAVKFTPESGSVQLVVRRAGDVVEFVVADTGRGISREFLPLVFEPFRQADGSTTRSEGGLGLGLSIVKHLVDAHGGSVGVESDGEGKGATFTVRLPVNARSAGVRPSSEDDAIEAYGVGVATTSLDGVSVLVVDDDDECRQVVTAHLELYHAEVFTAASVAQARDLLQRKHVDVLIADIAMPEEDGHTLVRHLRQSGTPAASIPAAALSALVRKEDRQRSIDAGFQLHLAKPIDGRSLVSAVMALHKLNRSA